MNKTELLKLIADGENSGLEFKRDDLHPQQLSREMAALLNRDGGRILLGVEDDGTVSGLARRAKEAEEWVMNVARENVQPPADVKWSCLSLDDGKAVGVIELSAVDPGKPYKAKRGDAFLTFIRAGTTVRSATREEEGRLYQAGRLMRYELTAVADADAAELDAKRLENYCRAVLGLDWLEFGDSRNFRQALRNLNLLTELDGQVCPTVAGLLLFGRAPNHRLPQAGITATAYSGVEKEYDTFDEELIRGPLLPLLRTRADAEVRFADAAMLEAGVIDRAVEFVTRNMGSIARLQGARRIRRPAFVAEAVREAVVNAVVHRDYTYTGTDIEISLYRDRLEIISPGKTPNGVTVEKMKQGIRAARNDVLKEILRDYDYIEHRGLGIPRRIIKATRAHNGTEPELVEDESRFMVRLWKNPQGER